MNNPEVRIIVSQFIVLKSCLGWLSYCYGLVTLLEEDEERNEKHNPSH